MSPGDRGGLPADPPGAEGEPTIASAEIVIKEMSECARCGGAHEGVTARRLQRPFDPPEASPMMWTHWFPCPVNGEPVLVAVMRSWGRGDQVPPRRFWRGNSEGLNYFVVAKDAITALAMLAEHERQRGFTDEIQFLEVNEVPADDARGIQIAGDEPCILFDMPYGHIASSEY